MYREGATCFKETEMLASSFGLDLELPDVIMVCNSGIVPFKSTEGQTRTKHPTVKTAVTAFDKNLDTNASLFPFWLIFRGGVKKVSGLLDSETSSK